MWSGVVGLCVHVVWTVGVDCVVAYCCCSVMAVRRQAAQRNTWLTRALHHLHHTLARPYHNKKQTLKAACIACEDTPNIGDRCPPHPLVCPFHVSYDHHMNALIICCFVLFVLSFSSPPLRFLPWHSHLCNGGCLHPMQRL